METQLQDTVAVSNLVDLYKKVFPSVAKVVKKYGGCEEDAKDVFHDSLLIWLEKPEPERATVTNDVAYIVTVARHEWFRRVEKMKKLRGASFIEETEEFKVSGELYNYLVKAGKKCMDLLQAFYYEKHAASDIAQRFGLSGSHSASAQKYKCLEKLRHLVKINNHSKEDFYEN
jgi:DNA-directed RNA polymerase specialized sigma24 family protein